MSAPETYLPPSPLAYVQEGLHRVHQTFSRISLRDIHHTQERTLGPLVVGDWEDAVEPTVLQNSNDGSPQLLQVGTVRRGHHSHEMRIISPLSPEDSTGEVLDVSTGITLDFNTPGSAMTFMDMLAAAHPGAITAGINTPFVGPREPRGTLRQWMGLTFEDIAEARLDIGQKMFQDRLVHVIAYSMSGAIALRAVVQNLDKSRVHQASLSLLKAAVVRPAQAKRVYLGEFIPDVWRHPPSHMSAPSAEQSFSFSKFLENFPFACAGNVWQLRLGTSEELACRAVAAVPTFIGVGENCPLNRPDMTTAMQNASPNTVLKEYPNSGHSLEGQMEEVVEDISSFMRRVMARARQAKILTA